MKLDIDKENPIVKNIMFKNISSHIKTVKDIEEYGSYKYFMYANEDKATFSFTCLDFDKVYDFSAKEWIEEEFAGKMK